MFEDADVVHVYSREDAINDGELIDVSDVAENQGIKYPVALTAAAYNDAVEWDEFDEARKPCGQSINGRLIDVLMAFKLKAFYAKSSIISFEVLRVPRDSKSISPRITKLKAICGPGDDAEPVITIMLPSED